MAGIGFRLEKILEKDTYSSAIKAYFLSALIFSGPWLLSVITIFCLNYFSPKNIDIFELTFFRATVVYIFAFSLIFTGFLYLSLSRYLSDKLYMKEEDALVPVFNSSSLLVLVILTLSGVPFFAATDVPVLLKFLPFMIYMTIGMIWLVMIFLTALRDYFAILRAYVIGSIITIAASIIMGRYFGIAGYFGGYLLGHLVILTMLSARIFIEFESKMSFDIYLFPFLLKNKVLVLTGFFYNLAIWIDKIIFWISPHSIKVSGLLRTYPHYDSAVFLAYLTIIPALSLFLIQVETGFYRKYKGYYYQVLQKGTLSSIRKARANMSAQLRQSIKLIIVLQGVISMLCIVFANEITSALRLHATQVPLFRVSIMGAFLHAILLVAIIIILYFDFKAVALLVSSVFFVANGFLTYITIKLPLPYYGYGYLFSAFISVMLAFYVLDYKMNRLEYLTFALQPIGVHREEEVS